MSISSEQTKDLKEVESEAVTGTVSASVSVSDLLGCEGGKEKAAAAAEKKSRERVRVEVDVVPADEAKPRIAVGETDTAPPQGGGGGGGGEGGSRHATSAAASTLAAIDDDNEDDGNDDKGTTDAGTAKRSRRRHYDPPLNDEGAPVLPMPTDPSLYFCGRALDANGAAVPRPRDIVAPSAAGPAGRGGLTSNFRHELARIARAAPPLSPPVARALELVYGVGGGGDIGLGAVGGIDGGRCGSGGRRCPSCRRFSSLRRLDSLLRRFPRASAADAVDALRKRGGHAGAAAAYLGRVRGFAAVPEQELVDALAKKTGMPWTMCDVALRKGKCDVAAAEGYLLSGKGGGRGGGGMGANAIDALGWGRGGRGMIGGGGNTGAAALAALGIAADPGSKWKYGGGGGGGRKGGVEECFLEAAAKVMGFEKTTNHSLSSSASYSSAPESTKKRRQKRRRRWLRTRRESLLVRILLEYLNRRDPRARDRVRTVLVELFEAARARARAVAPSVNASAEARGTRDDEAGAGAGAGVVDPSSAPSSSSSSSSSSLSSSPPSVAVAAAEGSASLIASSSSSRNSDCPLDAIPKTPPAEASAFTSRGRTDRSTQTHRSPNGGAFSELHRRLSAVVGPDVFRRISFGVDHLLLKRGAINAWFNGGDNDDDDDVNDANGVNDRKDTGEEDGEDGGGSVATAKAGNLGPKGDVEEDEAFGIMFNLESDCTTWKRLPDDGVCHEENKDMDEEKKPRSKRDDGRAAAEDDTSLPEAIDTKCGHRMVLVRSPPTSPLERYGGKDQPSIKYASPGTIESGDNSKTLDGARELSPIPPTQCPLCCSALPSDLGGRYSCSRCRLCAGCVRAGVVLRCQGLLNGGHLHPHPLTYRHDRDCRAICDVMGGSRSGGGADNPGNGRCGGGGAVYACTRFAERDADRHVVAWSCDRCDFDVCPVCVAHERPPMFCRRTGSRLSKRAASASRWPGGKSARASAVASAGSSPVPSSRDSRVSAGAGGTASAAGRGGASSPTAASSLSSSSLFPYSSRGGLAHPHIGTDEAELLITHMMDSVDEVEGGEVGVSSGEDIGGGISDDEDDDIDALRSMDEERTSISDSLTPLDNPMEEIEREVGAVTEHGLDGGTDGDWLVLRGSSPMAMLSAITSVPPCSAITKGQGESSAKPAGGTRQKISKPGYSDREEALRTDPLAAARVRSAYAAISRGKTLQKLSEDLNHPLDAEEAVRAGAEAEHAAGTNESDGVEPGAAVASVGWKDSSALRTRRSRGIGDDSGRDDDSENTKDEVKKPLLDRNVTWSEEIQKDEIGGMDEMKDAMLHLICGKTSFKAGRSHVDNDSANSKDEHADKCPAYALNLKMPAVQSGRCNAFSDSTNDVDDDDIKESPGSSSSDVFSDSSSAKAGMLQGVTTIAAKPTAEEVAAAAAAKASTKSDQNESKERYTAALEHAVQCSRSKSLSGDKSACSEPNCAKIKSYLRHVSTCKLAGCRICKRLCSLMRAHARRCQDSPHCGVPQCAAMRTKLRLPVAGGDNGKEQVKGEDPSSLVSKKPATAPTSSATFPCSKALPRTDPGWTAAFPIPTHGIDDLSRELAVDMPLRMLLRDPLGDFAGGSRWRLLRSLAGTANQSIDQAPGPRADETAVAKLEAEAAKQWEDVSKHHLLQVQQEGCRIKGCRPIVVGTGQVGIAPSTLTEPSGPESHFDRLRAVAGLGGARWGAVGGAARRRNERHANGAGKNLSSFARLSDDAFAALNNFRRSRTGPVPAHINARAETVTAVELTLVENLLRKGQALRDSNTRKAIFDAVGAGCIPTAGTLLLQHSYATIEPFIPGNDDCDETRPSSAKRTIPSVFLFSHNEYKENGRISPAPSSSSSSSSSVGDESGPTKCWCGDVIDVHTSPDGAVGCLNGHAMHASCCVDLLLSGGSCPTCREPLFLAGIEETEARAAVDFVDAEVTKSRIDGSSGESGGCFLSQDANAATARSVGAASHDNFEIGDVVAISADEDLCARVQTDDPLAGGWDDDMRAECGLEGRITALLTDDGSNGSFEEGNVVAIRVRSKSTRSQRHYVRKIRDQFRCDTCHMNGPSTQTGRCQCVHCLLCERCCQRPGSQRCSKESSEFSWSPSLLTLKKKSDNIAVNDGSEGDDDMIVATKAAERHMRLLRAELAVLKAAREALKQKISPILPSEGSDCDLIGETEPREMSPNCIDGERKEHANSLAALASKLSAADLLRSRHLLSLTEEWSDSEVIGSFKESVRKDVFEGRLEAAARKIRWHNAALVAEQEWWKDAASTTSDYIISSIAKVDLRAYPSEQAPLTGFSLKAETLFSSEQELLDESGHRWLKVAEPKDSAGANLKEGDPIVAYDGSISSGLNKGSLVGVRVRRGKDWKYQDQDGGVGSEGTIVAQAKGVVLVTWDGPQGLFKYRASPHGSATDLVAASVPPPPQGWLCVRQAGIESVPVSLRAKSALRCGCCNSGLIAPHTQAGVLTSVKSQHLNVGDDLLVGATLQPVVVDQIVDGRIYCTFLGKKRCSSEGSGLDQTAVDEYQRLTADHEGVLAKSRKRHVPSQAGSPVKRRKLDRSCFRIWYRPEDLIFPQEREREYEFEETRILNGRPHTRRDFFLEYGCSVDDAKKAWYAAGKSTKKVATFSPEEVGSRFASCLRGHLLHARCLQRTLFSGKRCPVKNCQERLWMPHVRFIKKDEDEADACCSGEDGGNEAEALRTASELSGHISAVAANHTGRSREEEASLPGKSRLKMCPSCCSGPFANDYCSNMRSHHGECSKGRLGQFGSSTYSPCTRQGHFRATATEIAERLTGLSDTKTVNDVLPRCPTHDVVVMFNGCTACGYLFTDTSWHNLPTWDPNAKAKLALDLKKSNAARLLASQVRKEAAMLDFERSALACAKQSYNE